jgi:hypothetical protein
MFQKKTPSPSSKHRKSKLVHCGSVRLQTGGLTYQPTRCHTTEGHNMNQLQRSRCYCFHSINYQQTRPSLVCVNISNAVRSTKPRVFTRQFLRLCPLNELHKITRGFTHLTKMARFGEEVNLPALPTGSDVTSLLFV